MTVATVAAVGERVKPYFDEGGITIYHGDCREVLPQIGPVDLVITDPPYSVGGSRSEWRVTAAVGTGIYLAARSVRKGGAALVFTTSSGRGMEFTIGAVGGALPFNRLLVWHKKFVYHRVAGPFRWDLVSVLAFGRATFGLSAINKPECSSLHVTEGPRDRRGSRQTDHPAEVPFSVAEWLYEPMATEETVLLDPFMGSGSLLLPAAMRGRRAIGIEIEERYCEVAAGRIREAMGG